jgi:hypothetical protein
MGYPVDHVFPQKIAKKRYLSVRVFALRGRPKLTNTMRNGVRKLPFAARLISMTDRGRRFLDNRTFRVRPWHRQIAQQLLAEAALCGMVWVTVDSSKVGSGHQLLMIALAQRKEALPIV